MHVHQAKSRHQANRRHQAKSRRQTKSHHQTPLQHAAGEGLRRLDGSGEITRWFGPAQAECLHAEADPRVGGRFRVIFRTPDGEEHDVSGVYREVVPNEKLVFTWAWRTMPERESLLSIALKRDARARC
jgi:hypothetical protein